MVMGQRCCHRVSVSFCVLGDPGGVTGQGMRGVVLLVGTQLPSDTRERQTLSWSEDPPQTKGRAEGAGSDVFPPSSGIRAHKAGLPCVRGVLQRRAEPALAVRSCRWGLALLKAQPGVIMGNRIPGSLPIQPGAAEA